MKWILVPILFMATSAGFINWQGIGTQTLAVFFGATDGAQSFMEANPANPHPTVKLPPKE
jgi:hypothetical protein